MKPNSFKYFGLFLIIISSLSIFYIFYISTYSALDSYTPGSFRSSALLFLYWAISILILAYIPGYYYHKFGKMPIFNRLLNISLKFTVTAYLMYVITFIIAFLIGIFAHGENKWGALVILFLLGIPAIIINLIGVILLLIFKFKNKT